MNLIRTLIATTLITILLSSNVYSADIGSCDVSVPVVAYKATIDSYKSDYKNLQTESNSWQVTANILFALTLIVTLLGAIVTALQPLPDTTWKKWLLAFIGIVIAGATSFKDNLPEGSYKSFQQDIGTSKAIGSDLERAFAIVGSNGITLEDLKEQIVYICGKVHAYHNLTSKNSSKLPLLFDLVIGTAKADPPNWIAAHPQLEQIISKGEGYSISTAKENAEKEGSSKVSYAIGNIINQTLTKPIYKPFKESLQDSLTNQVEKKEVFFDSSANLFPPQITFSFWINYQFDKGKIKEILSGITFPLTIFSTDLISAKTTVLNDKLTDYGFIVSINPAPRGSTSETNTIFVGEGVPVEAVKEIVRILITQDIPLKAVVYPWGFQKSSLPDIQKINYVQIGGASIFEGQSKLQDSDIERLYKASSQNDLKEFCKEATDKLKAALGYNPQDRGIK